MADEIINGAQTTTKSYASSAVAFDCDLCSTDETVHSDISDSPVYLQPSGDGRNFIVSENVVATITERDHGVFPESSSVTSLPPERFRLQERLDENEIGSRTDFGIHVSCADLGSTTMNGNPTDVYQSLPPISSFRAPLQAAPQVENFNPDPCSYVPDFSDLYQENTYVWQPLYEREQQSSNLSSDLEYLLERAGLYSQAPQQSGVSSTEPYRSQQWADQPVYETNYHDLQKSPYASTSYGASQQMYQPLLANQNLQGSVGHIPVAASSYPVGFRNFGNAYPEYVAGPSQNYVPQGFLRPVWERQAEPKAIVPEQQTADGYRQEESLLKQYLMLPSHELGQISGGPCVRQKALRCDRPPLTSQFKRTAPAPKKQTKAKSPPVAIVTSSITQTSVNNSVENESTVVPPLTSTPTIYVPSVAPQATEQFQDPKHTAVSTLVPSRCTPVVSASVVRPPAPTQAQVYLYLSAFARAAAAAAVGSVSGLQQQPQQQQLNPFVIQSQVPRANALGLQRPKTISKRSSTVSSSAKKTVGNTVKELLRNKAATSSNPTVAPNQGIAAKKVADALTPRVLPIVQPLTVSPFFGANLLGDNWKVQVSPVVNIRPTAPPLKPNRLPRSTQSGQCGSLHKRIRLSAASRAAAVPSGSRATSGLPAFRTGRVNAKEHRPRHFEMSRLQIGNFVVLSIQQGNGKYTNKMKAVFTKRRFVYEFETLVHPSPGKDVVSSQEPQTGLFCIVVPFDTVQALRCESGNQVRLIVDRQPLMFLGNRSKRQGVVEMLSVYDTSNPIDITNSQLKRSPLHLITLKPNHANTLQSYLWLFSERFRALSEVEIPLVVKEVELPPPESEEPVSTAIRRQTMNDSGVVQVNVTKDSPKPIQEDKSPTEEYPCQCPFTEYSGASPISTAGDQISSTESVPVAEVVPSLDTEPSDVDKNTPMPENCSSTKETTEQCVSQSESEEKVTSEVSDIRQLHIQQEDSSTRAETMILKLNGSSDGSSTEIEETEESKETGVDPDVAPTPKVTTAVVSSKGADTRYPLVNTCSCRISCRSQRCSCARAQRKCRAPSSDTDEFSSVRCQCNCCDNPLNILASLGIDEESAKNDHCLMQNVYKLLHLHSYLHQLVTLECCGQRAPLYQFLPGVVPCPNGNCSATLQYSWCRQLVCDSKAAPPEHCPVCGLCRFNDTKHCQACNRCYNLVSGDNPCPACAVRATLRARIPTNRS